MDQGTLAPIEVTRAHAQWPRTEQALITAEGLVRQQELIVKTAITRGAWRIHDRARPILFPTDTLAVPDQ